MGARRGGGTPHPSLPWRETWPRANSCPGWWVSWSAEERAFFLAFIKVPGISPKSGVRAMSLPPLQIAEAIAAANATMLTKLPGIGRKKAEQVISDAQRGNPRSFNWRAISRFHRSNTATPRPCTGTSWPCWWGQLGYRTPEAENLVERAVALAGSGSGGRGHPAGSVPAEPVGRINMVIERRVSAKGRRARRRSVLSPR